MMLSSQGENTKAFVKPRIREITMELLKIIRETENDDLTTGNLNLKYHTYQKSCLDLSKMLADIRGRFFL